MSRRTAALLCLLPLLLSACSTGTAMGGGGDTTLTVVASLFPQYDFARVIGGAHVEVKMLLAPGTESHSYDPTAADMAGIYAADLFVYTGAEMEPWAARLIESAPDTLRVLDASAGIDKLSDSHAHGHEDEHVHEDEHEHVYDPHIWLDPSLARQMVDAVAAALCELDEAHAADYRANAESYKDELQAYEDATWAAKRDAVRDTLVFGGRFAYQYYLQYFGFSYRTAYDSCSSQAEPSLKTVLELSSYVKDEGIPVVFHEEFVEPRVAISICEGTEAQPLLFSTAHNVTRDELRDGISFLDIMYRNLAHVQIALG